MRSSTQSKKIAKGAFIVLVSLIIGKGLSYLYTALLAKTGSSNYGLISLGFVIISILTIISMVGMNTGVMRYTAYYKGKKDKSRIKGAFLSSLKIVLPVSITLSVFLILFSDFISTKLFHNIELSPILKILAVSIPISVITNVILDMMTGLQNLFYSNFSKEIIDRILKIIFIFIAIFLGYGILGVATSYLIAVIMTFIVTFYFLNKKTFPLFSKKIKTVYYTRKLLIFSYPLLFIGIITLLVKWTDVLMIGFFRTTSEVGIYNVALPTANLLIIVPAALMALFTPIIVELYSKGDKKNIKLTSKRISKWIFYLNLPIFFVLLLLSSDFLRIMFGNEYVAGGVSLVILLFGYIFHSLSHIPSSTLLMIKKTKTIFLMGLISLIVNVALNYLLIPKYGINGAAISTSLSLIIGSILLLISSYKFNKFQPLSISYIKPIISGVIVSIIFYFLMNLFIMNSIIKIALFSIIFLVLYLVILYLLRFFDKEDKEILQFLLKKFRA